MALLLPVLTHQQQLGKLYAIQWVTILCYEYSKCLEYYMTEDSFGCVQRGAGPDAG